MKNKIHFTVNIAEDMLEGTTIESIQKDIIYHAERSGYIVDEVWTEEVEEVTTVDLKKDPKYKCIRRIIEDYIITNEGCLEGCDDLVKDIHDAVRILGIDNPLVDRI